MAFLKLLIIKHIIKSIIAISLHVIYAIGFSNVVDAARALSVPVFILGILLNQV